MARKRERAFALFGALLFLITSSALTIIVIYLIIQQNKTPGDGKASQQDTSKQTTPTATKLQGKPMQDFTPVAHIDQLQTIDLTPGTGDTVKAGDTVTVDYTGAVAATGTVFQSSLDSGQPVSFPLSGVIPGWSQGIPGMKVNGTRRLLIPAALAYGANPPAGSGIPANADLVFDVTLHKIGQ